MKLSWPNTEIMILGRNSAPDAEYFYGAEGLLAIHDSERGELWFCRDHLGSLRELDSTGMAVDYYPYGTRRSTVADYTDYQYSGKEYSSEIGLYYFTVRHSAG